MQVNINRRWYNVLAIRLLSKRWCSLSPALAANGFLPIRTEAPLEADNMGSNAMSLAYGGIRHLGLATLDFSAPKVF